MNIKPLHDKVVCIRDPHPDQTPGGILIPATAQTKMLIAQVLAVGDGIEHSEIQPGVKIAVGKYRGTEMVVDDREVLIVDEEDILGIVLEES